ncbi:MULTISPECIES: hypothetical protein [Gluconobacter]|uniref:hypothetical protein n=1 Tax=Gluconobacter japonicus TaxID=376620 RepID=UPI00031DF6A5
MMIETIIAVLLVSLAALYWYTRLFPTGWRRLKMSMGLATSVPSPSPAKGCDNCSACNGKSGGCH